MTKYAVISSQNFHFVITLQVTSDQKTSLMKVVKEYALIKEMSYRPLNMELFCHQIFILSQPY